MATHAPVNLIARFEALAEEERALVELIAVGDQSHTPWELSDRARSSALTRADGKLWHAQTTKTALARLARAGLVVATGGKYRGEPAILVPALLSAYRARRLKKLAATARTTRGRGNNFGRYASANEAAIDVCLAMFGIHERTFVDLESTARDQYFWQWSDISPVTAFGEYAARHPRGTRRAGRRCPSLGDSVGLTSHTSRSCHPRRALRLDRAAMRGSEPFGA